MHGARPVPAAGKMIAVDHTAWLLSHFDPFVNIADSLIHLRFCYFFNSSWQFKRVAR